jgi:hypothetical protein
MKRPLTSLNARRLKFLFEVYFPEVGGTVGPPAQTLGRGVVSCDPSWLGSTSPLKGDRDEKPSNSP